MAFSLSRLFKGKPADQDGENAPSGAPAHETPTAAPAPAAPPAATPASVRTVMPKSAQPVSLRDPSVRQPVSLTSAVTQPVKTNRIPPPVVTNRVSASVRPPARKITFPVPSGPRPVVVAAPAAHMPSSMAAPVPEAPDATVTLEIGDFIDRLPPNFLKPGPVDRQQTIEFRASELYSDLTKGRASVPASTIYAKVPAIFARPVTDTEDAEVSLPLQKLVEQLSAAFQTRTDQVAEENVGEIETPFLQVAKEDSERLPTATGTVAGAIRPSALLSSPSPVSMPSLEETVPDFPVRPSHRTGQISTISAPKLPLDPPPAPIIPAVGTPATGPINPGKRPPSTVRASVAGGKIRLSGPSAITRMSAAPVQPIPPGSATMPPSVSTASQRIQLPMQGVNGPAASPSLAVSKKTARIQIPPISLRAGGPGAAPRPGSVPAPASVPVQPSPVSIRPPAGTDLPVTFRSSPPPPPSAKLPPPSFAPTPRPNFPPPVFPAAPPVPAPVAAVSAMPVPAAPAATDDRKIDLSLAAVLRGIPSEALTVEPWTVADDVRFSLPFAGVERQLSTGRVSIGVDVFLQALPEDFRQVIKPDSGLTEIQLPLPEIFQNLPASALAIRPDQVAEETGSHYPTPFSQKADEDAQRFGVTPTAESQAALASEMVAPVAEAAPTVEEAPVAPVEEDSQEVSPVDQSQLPAEAAAPAVEPEVQSEPHRDIPLDLEPYAPVEPPQAEEPAPFEETVNETPVAEVPAVVENVPAQPVVEPPAQAEPSPLEEALAILESTTPVRTPEPPVDAEPSVQASVSEKIATPALVVTPIKGKDTVLQTLFMTEEEIDAKVVVRLVCQLPGVNGCAVMFADGLRLAGNFPDGDAEGFSAMTPPFYKKAQNFASELKLGGLKAFTVYTDQDLLSFFMHADICVSVRHAGRGFLPGVREKLEVVTRELAEMYSATK